jgi:hypothetical protein
MTPALNLEVYEKDPRTHSLLNQGVAKVTSGDSSGELETLRYELKNFVCEGQYAEGLSRILSTYLGHLDKSEQPGVWVSGFFGSGKSHLVKMLQHLWTDFEFPDGAKSRGEAKLTTGVKDLLKELTNAAKRHGGLHAAAGDLRTEAKESIRLALLGILFKSVGLPGDYTRACFQMWLRDEKVEEEVRRFITDAGGSFERELTNLYVSKLMAQAILKSLPDFASKPSDVALILKSQFPPDPKDVSTDDMIARIMQAVGRNGKLPYTVVILDEVQQYINDDPDRSKAVQDLKEQCCAKLGANFLLIGTGQNALSGTALLQRLQGRFPVTVELQDTDVEQVTREVVLKKKPSAESALKKILDEHSGEIERQLNGTKIAFSGQDRTLLVQDYPILPVRRRFWERVLRAVDKAGTGAQLRNQLWVVHDAVKQTADWPLGNVVGGAFIYDASIKSSALKSGTLLQEISETIEKQKKEEDGELRYQLCALIFLIGQLPHNNEPLDAGVRADAETLADLLVTDLTSSSAPLRKKIPELLEKLVTSGAIMPVEDEFRMQTREGAQWNQSYLEAKNRLINDAGKLASERSQLLRTQCGEVLKKFKLPHGASKEYRKIDLHFGDVAPQIDGSAIPVWVRDGWEVEEKAVLNDARAAGDKAIVYGYIPRKMAEELKQAIAGYYAATTTLQAKGSPSGDEGIQARKAMETRQEQSEKVRNGLIADILNETQVYLAGGDPVGGTLLNQKIQDAATLCLDRLYPLFHLADHPASDWEKVYKRAKDGAADALTAVGHKEDADKHPVCKAVSEFVGSGKKGADVQKHFESPKYGWPRDAINAALVVLVQAGTLRAISGSGAKEMIPAAKLDQKTIAAVEFRCETVTLSKVQLIELRGLFKKIGLNTQPNQESSHAVEFLGKLTRLAEAAGGDAPLPKSPDIAHIADLANRVGNDQLKAIHDIKDRLAQQILAWETDRDLILQRLPHWKQLEALLKFAADLPVAAEVQPEVNAIERDRKLLGNPDPVPGMVEKLTGALRAELNEVHSRISDDHEARMAALTESSTWKQITQPQRHEILNANLIRALPKVAVGTTDEILDTLRHTKLTELRAISEALPTRFSKAAAAAAKLLEPKAQHVSLPGGTIKNEDDLKTWLSDAEDRIREKMKEGPVIL